MRKLILYGLLVASILIVLIIHFFEFLKTPVWFDLNATLVNDFFGTLSFAYITSFIFYGIVVLWKRNEDRDKIHEILEEPLTVYLNSLCAVYNTINPPKKSINIEELVLIQIPTLINQNNDLYSTSNGTNFVQGRPVQIAWIQWLKKINDRLLQDTNDIFSKYSFFLETDMGANYEKLKISNYTRLVNSANMARINNLSDLELGDKFKNHHSYFLSIFDKVFKDYKTHVIFDGERFRFDYKK